MDGTGWVRRAWSRTGWARIRWPPRDYIAEMASSRFKPWSGVAPDGYDLNWLGQRTDVLFVKGWDDEARRQERRYDPCPYPALGEEVFEWLTLLDAVLEARDRFVMVEAGASFGRWLVSAALALRHAHPGTLHTLIGIMGDAHHYDCLLKHVRDNGLDPAEYRLSHGAVSDRDGEDIFLVSDDPAAWWGQELASSAGDAPAAPNRRGVQVRTHSVETLLRAFDHVDYMDIDIQGAGAAAISAGMKSMTRKVRRTFVETHSAKIHAAVAEDFRSRRWKPLHVYGFGSGLVSEDRTPFGTIVFHGGVQCWLNRQLPPTVRPTTR